MAKPKNIILTEDGVITQEALLAYAQGKLSPDETAKMEKLMRDLLARPDELTKLGQMAREATAAVRGASLRDAQLIAGLLPRLPEAR